LPEEIAAWKLAFLNFVRKLARKYGRPAVLKSPPHTARIKLILDVFPQAKFVHIHRNPYAVFPSARHTFLVNMNLQRLQKPRLADLDEHIIARYREMYDAFFAQRDLVPAGHYCEIAYEELDREPIDVMRSIYTALDLPDFKTVAPALKGYLDSIAGYKKNVFKPLDSALRERIAHEWGRCFEEWGYPKNLER
jgi:hypothetical protein